MAQRMESVAPPGGVMLSASTARLVDGAATLGEPESVRIKGADEPVAAQRLLGMGGPASRRRACRVESCWAAVGDVRRRGLAGPCDRRPRRGGRRGRAAWYREKPSSARAFGHGVCAWCRGVHYLLRVAHQPDSLPRHRSAACGWRSELRVSTRGSPAMDCATGSLTQTRRTCCYLMTCWASPIPMWSCRRSIRMLVGGG